jgi:hypothetical protein
MKTNTFDKTMFILLMVVMLTTVGRADSITADKSIIYAYQEKFSSELSAATDTVAFYLSYDGAGTTVTSAISAGGDSMEVWVDGAPFTGFDYPVAANQGLNITAYFAAGNDVSDLVAKLDAHADFTCTIGENMPPWLNSAYQIKATSSTTVATTATAFYAGGLCSVQAVPVSGQTAIIRGFTTYATFSSGTGTFNIYEYNPLTAVATLRYKKALATTVALEKNLNEIRIDATSGNYFYAYSIYSAAAPNAADYVQLNYSSLRR